jgi:uncharacterized protein (TIGR00106 family)
MQIPDSAGWSTPCLMLTRAVSTHATAQCRRSDRRTGQPGARREMGLLCKRGRTTRTGEAMMKVLVNFQVIPMGTDVSVSAYIAECERVLADSGLQVELHANGTNIEGEWDAVSDALRQCHERLHEMGVQRIQSVVSIGTRSDRDQSLQDKVASVQQRLT